MWSRIVGLLTGLAVVLVAIIAMYLVSIEPLLSYDKDSFYIDQTKSGIYTQGMPLSDISGNTGAVVDSRPFSINHIVMLPAVDATLTGTDSGVKFATVFRVGATERPPRTRNETGTSVASQIWSNYYVISLNEIYNKYSMLEDFHIRNPYSNLRSAVGTSGLNLMVDGRIMADGKANNLIFYDGRTRPDRTFWWPVK